MIHILKHQRKHLAEFTLVLCVVLFFFYKIAVGLWLNCCLMDRNVSVYRFWANLHCSCESCI